MRCSSTPRRAERSPWRKRTLILVLFSLVYATLLGAIRTFQLFSLDTHPTTSARRRCRLAVRSLGTPSHAIGNCSAPGELERLVASNKDVLDFSALLVRYQVLEHLVPYARAAAAMRWNWAFSRRPDVVLLDDSDFTAAFFCLDFYKYDDKTYSEWYRLNPILLEEREARVRAALETAEAAIPHILVDGFSTIPQHRPLETNHSLLFKLLLDTISVPVDLRAHTDKYLVVPYVSELQASDAELRGPKSTLLYFKGGCRPQGAVGQRMRTHIMAQISSSRPPGIDATCAPDHTGYDSYEIYERELMRARYCLALPGDVPSTSRLSEIIAAGCIPVLVGPPWTYLPLLPHVKYEQFALFFVLTNVSAWLTREDEAELADPASDWAMEPRMGRFLNTAPLYVAHDILDVIEQLRRVSPERERALRLAGARFRVYFAASTAPTSDAAAAILDAACETFTL